jgi:hypothetical protein
VERRQRCPAPAPAEWVGLAVLAAVAVPMLFLALYPSVSWDADTYHLGVPRLWLDHGGFRQIPFNVYSNWPLSTELLFSMALLVPGFCFPMTWSWTSFQSPRWLAHAATCWCVCWLSHVRSPRTAPRPCFWQGSAAGWWQACR